MGTTVVVWNGRPPSPAGAFSAGRPSADAGLSANNGTPATGSFLNQLKVSFGTKKKETSLALETDIRYQINCECQRPGLPLEDQGVVGAL